MPTTSIMKKEKKNFPKKSQKNFLQNKKDDTSAILFLTIYLKCYQFLYLKYPQRLRLRHLQE